MAGCYKVDGILRHEYYKQESFERYLSRRKCRKYYPGKCWKGPCRFIYFSKSKEETRRFYRKQLLLFTLEGLKSKKVLRFPNERLPKVFMILSDINRRETYNFLPTVKFGSGTYKESYTSVLGQV